jgi:hypothetical protein
MNGMRAIVLLLILAVATPSWPEWYQNGTLHRESGGAWKSATAENRLATSADFVSKVASPRSMEDLREKAVTLSACISEAVGDSSGDNQEVSAIAAACVILLGYVR